MVARVIPDPSARLSRWRGFAIGIVAGLLPAGLALFAFLGSYPWFGLTLAVACLGSGGVIGSTIGPRLAARPDPLAVLMVSAIAVVVGDLFATPMLAWGGNVFDPIGAFVAGLIIVGLPAYFFLAFPGLVLFILVARRAASDTER